MNRFLFALKTIFRRNEMERSMKEEIRNHIELQALELQKQGMARAEAMRKAKRMFGRQINIVEDCRASWGVRLLDEFVNDVCYSWVQLKKHPLFSLVAIFSLGIGIGINLSLFSALNGILLKPLPVDHPEQLREINWKGPRINGYISGRMMNLSGNSVQCNAISHLLYQDFRKQAAPIADVFCWANVSSLIVDLGNQKRTDFGVLVSNNYFEVFGAKPLLGRLRVDEDSGDDPARSVWLSFSTWRRDF